MMGNLLHINSYFSNSKFYKNLYDNQIMNDLDIHVYIPVPTDFANNGFDYGKYSTISKNHKKYDRYIFHLKHHKIYKDVKEKYNIDQYSIIHAHSLFSNGYISMKLKEDFGIPYIVAVRDTDLNIFFKQMLHLRRLGIQILKNASHIIFLSKPYKEDLMDKYIPANLQGEFNNKASIIPNGIDQFWLNNLGFPKKN